MYTINTLKSDLKLGDKVVLEHYKKPLTVVLVNAHNQVKLRTANGKSVWTIQHNYARVVTKVSEVIR